MSQNAMRFLIALLGAIVVETGFLLLFLAKRRRHLPVRLAPSQSEAPTARESRLGRILKETAVATVASVLAGIILFYINPLLLRPSTHTPVLDTSLNAPEVGAVEATAAEGTGPARLPTTDYAAPAQQATPDAAHAVTVQGASPQATGLPEDPDANRSGPAQPVIHGSSGPVPAQGSSEAFVLPEALGSDTATPARPVSEQRPALPAAVQSAIESKPAQSGEPAEVAPSSVAGSEVHNEALRIRIDASDDVAEVGLVAPTELGAHSTPTGGRVVLEGASTAEAFVLQPLGGITDQEPATGDRISLGGVGTSVLLRLSDPKPGEVTSSPRVLTEGAATVKPFRLAPPDGDTSQPTRAHIVVEGALTTQLFELRSPEPWDAGM